MNRIKEWFLSLDQRSRQLLLMAAAALLLILVGYSTLHSHLNKLGKQKLSREQTLQELLVLKQRHQEAVGGSQRLNNRMAASTAADTPATVVEQTGLVPKGGIQSKPLPRQERGNLIEESAELTLSGLSLNETVNLLHRLEQGSKPLIIRKGLIRTRFNEPAKLDLTLQVGLLRPAGQQPRP